jgi:hypothetical protein
MPLVFHSFRRAALMFSSRTYTYLNPTPKALLVNSLSTIERDSSFLPSPLGYVTGLLVAAEFTKLRLLEEGV